MFIFTITHAPILIIIVIAADPSFKNFVRKTEKEIQFTNRG